MEPNKNAIKKHTREGTHEGKISVVSVHTKEPQPPRRISRVSDRSRTPPACTQGGTKTKQSNTRSETMNTPTAHKPPRDMSKTRQGRKRHQRLAVVGSGDRWLG